MKKFRCPYLGNDIEFSDERENHIRSNHPDLLPQYLTQIEQTLNDPDQVNRSLRMSTARLFYKKFDEIGHGKFIVVVVVSELNEIIRHWIITAYSTRKITNGELEWRKT